MNNKNTVLIVGPTPPPMGGIATYVNDMLKSSINNEYKILHLNTARSHFIKKSFIKNLLLFSKNTLKLIRSLCINHPKIVHIHTSSYLAFWEKSIFAIISKLFLKKVILHIHGAEFDNFYTNSNKINRWLIEAILNSSDKVIVLSMQWKLFFLQILKDEKISIIQNGIDISKYNIFENKTKNTENTTIKILFLGNLVKRKGVYDILKSISMVVNKFQNIHFTFAGSEEQSGEIDKLKSECISKGIGEHVTFISNFSQEEKIKMLDEADIYLLPSYAEGLPISLLEAMAAGLPIISTPVGGIPEVITEEKNGYLINPGDHENLSNKINELIENPQLRRNMSINNLEKINQIYNWDTVANKITIEYDKLTE